MTRLFLLYQWAAAVMFGWAVLDSFFEKHGTRRFWKRVALVPVWPVALLIKRGRELLLFGGL